MDDVEAKEELEKGFDKAEEILENQDKMEEFLRKLEAKLSEIPVAGKQLSMVPVLVSLLKSYIKKEYQDIPVKSIIAVISALLYWILPADVIPDMIPGIGYIDDASVVAFCLKMIGDDLKDYQTWRDQKKGNEPKVETPKENKKENK